MAISGWPASHQDKGGVRHQFHRVIDIVPTILEAAKVRQPDIVDGIKQSPIEGVSPPTRSTRRTPTPTTHKTQYFEMMADRAIYHDGWIASTKVMRAVGSFPAEGRRDGLSVGSSTTRAGLDTQFKRRGKEPGQA